MLVNPTSQHLALKVPSASSRSCPQLDISRKNCASCSSAKIFSTRHNRKRTSDFRCFSQNKGQFLTLSRVSSKMESLPPCQTGELSNARHQTDGFGMINSTDPGISLAYRFTRGSAPGIMFLTGFGSTMEGSKAKALEKMAQETAREMVRFDYRGHGQSGGSFVDCCLGDWIADALTVLDRVTSGRPMVLVGSSMGGWIALHLCLARPHRVAGVVGIATAADFLDRRWKTLSDAEREVLARDGLLSWESEYSGFTYTITERMFEEGRRHLLLPRSDALPISCPVRLLHGTADNAVPWQISAQVLEKLSSADATLTLIKGGDHRLADSSELERLKSVVTDLCDLVDAHK